MNKSHHFTAVLFLSITAILIGTTFSLFLLQKASAPSMTSETVLETPLATSTIDIYGDVTIKTFPRIHSFIERVEITPEGTRREIRNEVLVQTWKHKNGIIVSLYEKDYFYSFFDDQPARQLRLQMTRYDGSVIELFSHIPEAVPAGSVIISDIEFSPKGTYIMFGLVFYESLQYRIFDSREGQLVSPKEDDYSSNYDWPYWNSDESKLVMVRSGAPIDGTEAQLSYSPTGRFEDLEQITSANDIYQENFIYDVTIEGNKLSAKTSSNEWESGIEGTIVVDMNTGTYRAKPEIEW